MMEKSNVNFASNSGSSSRRNSERRRVSFPESELVSYAEPMNPLTLGQNVSVEQVRSAYVLSCVKYRTSPIRSNLDQISKFVLIEEQRETRFELKDLTLTSDICETLEEILRRVQFVEMEISNCTICFDGAKALFEMMEYYDTTTKLKLNVTYALDQHSWEAIKQFLFQSVALSSFEIFGMELLESQFNTIVGSLAGNTHLESVTFKNCSFPVPIPMNFLASKLVQSSAIRELHLAHVGLRTEDIEVLCNGIRNNSSLSVLDLSNNNICDDGASYIFKCLCDKEPISRQLTVLILWNTALTEKLAVPLIRLLRDDYKLELLNIGHNQFKDEGMLAIEQDMATNKSLVRLGFQKCGLTNIGLEVASRIILQNKYLERLDLRGNNISLDGLQTFCNNFLQCDSVVTVDFDKAPLDQSIPTSTYESLLETINIKREENKILKQESVAEEGKVAVSRKISLTCQTLSTQKFRAPIQAARSSSGRLRSPTASPSTSRKPAPTTKSRFQITAVSENQNQAKSVSKSRFIVSSVQDNFTSQQTEQLISNNNNTKPDIDNSVSISDDGFKGFHLQTEKLDLFPKEDFDNSLEKMEGIQEIEVNVCKSSSEHQMEIKNMNNTNEHHESISAKNGIKILDKISNFENAKDDAKCEIKLDAADDNYISDDKMLHMDDCLDIDMCEHSDMHEEMMDTSGHS